MMPTVDALPNEMGFDEAGRWHQARVLYMPPRRSSENPLAPARGAVYGLLASGVLWVVLLLAVRVLRAVL
jgi:hypothetical protein